MSRRAPERKGSRIEREIVARHIKTGVHAARVPFSGAAGGDVFRRTLRFCGAPVREPRTARGKRLDERNRLAAHYRREEARRVAEALASPQGRRLAGLLTGFDHLTIDDADLMITTVATQDWLLRADADFRHMALRLIDARIARIRREAGLPEFDDPLPGEPDNAFLILKRMLRVT